jgi:hypothetical protein
MPGLKLTLGQAARIFGADADETKKLLHALGREGFLVCDPHGAYRRRDSADRVRAAQEGRADAPCAHDRSPEDREKRIAAFLDSVGVELPCLVCDRSYSISLTEIRLSQMMMDAGCQVRHFAECSPAAVAHLMDPAVLEEFEMATHHLQAAAEDAGGRLVCTSGQR